MSFSKTDHTLQASLRTALTDASLVFPAQYDSYLRALIEQRGEVEWSQLRYEIGDEIIERDLRKITLPDIKNSIKWVLGYGSFLGEFAAAPLHPDFNETHRAASIGARVNLIVSLYDSYLDQGFSASDILADNFSPGEEIQLVSGLVRGYFRLVKKPIPLLARTISRMYEAEKASVNGEFDDQIWRRKSALPLVVMGLSICRQETESVPCYSSYLAWLYRAGCCLGWIDDASDIERDRISGRRNRFEEEKAAQHTVNLTGRVMEWWDRHSASTDCRHVFLYCVHSWITPRTS